MSTSVPSPLPNNRVRLLTLGDSALTVEFGQVVDDAINRRVHELAGRLMAGGIPGLLELVPAYSSLTIHFDLLVTSPQTIAAIVAKELARPSALGEEERPVVEIPAIYGRGFGPDLEFVASHNGLSPEEVIRLHSGSTYRVFTIGFAPGFPYLGPLPPQITVPRLPVPRLAVPAGSVGIAGSQTGIYPFSIAGGWRLIGRCPLRLFDLQRVPTSLLQPGDRVRFRAVDAGEYAALCHLERTDDRLA